MKQKDCVMKVLQWILLILMVFSILYFVLGELLMPSEKMYLGEDCNLFQDGWEQVYPNGDRKSITIPGDCNVKSGDVLTIEKTLDVNQEDTWVCIRSSQQDIRIFVDEELREEYTTKETRRFGKNSVSVYVFFPLYQKDAGKKLRMEIVSISPYSGYVNEIYEGDRSDIWKHLLTLYFPGTLVALFMMLLSLAVVCYSTILFHVYKKRMEIMNLGSGLLLASIWLLAESRLRQVILPNSSIASDVGFFMVMILPYPFLTYINNIQKKRYQWVYMLIAILTIINFVVCTLLQLFNVYDFSETMGISHGILIFLIITLFVTVLIDLKNGHIHDYPEVAVGLVGMMLSGLYEIYLVYDKSSLYNGIVLCIGLVFLLLAAGMKTGRDMLMIEKEKQLAIIANESKNQFLANMSHEIRTPINTVIGFNEMILRENKDESIQEYANNIQNASRLLLGLINDVLDFSKIEAGKLEVSENPYDVYSVLNEVVFGSKIRAQNKKLEFYVNLDNKLPQILKGDELRIKQVANNLLSNAIKYTEQGSITFSAKGLCTNDKFSLVLSIEDTGIGIKKEDLAKLFVSFQRLELNKNRYIEGTGLGLSITKQLIIGMNGSIEVDSEYGKGSRFTVYIPQEIMDDTPIKELEENFNAKDRLQTDCEAGESVEEFLYAPNASVLVVDDNRMNLTVVKALLKRSQIQLDFASGGDECLTLSRQKKYDLILMDHMMPDPDGVKTLHIIRGQNDNPNQNTPMIVLTANAVAGAQELYIQEGFAAYLSKPILGEQLEQALRKFIQQEKYKK